VPGSYEPTPIDDLECYLLTLPRFASVPKQRERALAALQTLRDEEEQNPPQ